MKLVEVQSTKEFASTFLADIFFKMAVNRVLDAAPAAVAITVTKDELNHLINDTIAYIWRLEERGCDKPEFGYDSRKALLEKLEQFRKEHFTEMESCSC